MRQIINPANAIGQDAIRRAYAGARITEGSIVEYVKQADGWHGVVGTTDSGVVWTDEQMFAHVRGGATRATHLDGESAQAEALAAGVCPRCAGTGSIPQFSHIDGGRCFDCGGTGKRRR